MILQAEPRCIRKNTALALLGIVGADREKAKKTRGRGSEFAVGFWGCGPPMRQIIYLIALGLLGV